MYFIYSKSFNLTISFSKIDSNTKRLYVEERSIITIVNSTFFENYRSYRGAAHFYFFFFHFIGPNFSFNRAEFSGAFYVTYSNMNAINCIFDSNLIFQISKL